MPTPALGIYETGHGPSTAALTKPETAAEKDDLERSRPWVASLTGPTPRSGKIESGRDAMKMKLSDAPGLPLSELRMHKPRTMTSLAPDRLPNMVRFYGLERRKRMARLSRILEADKRWALERQQLALPVPGQTKGAHRWGSQAQLVETLHHRCRPTPVPSRQKKSKDDSM